jgi:hypothetical protein
MVKVTNYDKFEDLARFIYSMHIRELGSGSEGVVYLGKDKYAYKLNYEEPWASDTRQLSPNEIISKEDADLPSFAFPLEIYTVEGIIMGCKMERVKNNLLSTEHTISYMDFFDIDIYEFYEAYKVLLEDVKKLSDLKIKLFDVANNVMYDGNKLTVVDTFYYTRELKEQYEKNLYIVEKAVEQIFNFWLENSGLEEQEITEHDVLAYLEHVFDAMSSKNMDEEFFYDEIIGKKKK